MHIRCLISVLAVLGLVFSRVAAGTMETRYPDGKLHLKYEVDDQGKKNGSFEEFDSTGKIKVKARYRNDKLNGVLVRFEKGKAVLTQLWKDGVLAHPRSIADVKRVMAEIFSGPVKAGTDVEAEQALRRLKAFRYLAEVPYEDLQLDADLSRGAQAAAGICARLGKLDHNPPNPGLPEADYQLALGGARKSNLAAGLSSLPAAVDRWLFDSDPANFSQMGHRRWCLNPRMQKVGFGKFGAYSAMWAFDSSRKELPDFDFVTFPARGPMPVEFFGPAHGWSVSPNPDRYRAPGGPVQPKVYLADAALNKVGEPLRLGEVSLSNFSAGLPWCIIFNVDPSVAVPGRRVVVEIDGLTRVDGDKGPLTYHVEFVTLR
jgi:uncharacterized protein YkwD